MGSDALPSWTEAQSRICPLQLLIFCN